MQKRHAVRYFSSQPPCAVVAVINYTQDKTLLYPEEVFDWGAYIGGGLDTAAHRDSAESLGEWVARHGIKLHTAEALVFFPQLPAEKYRA